MRKPPSSRARQTIRMIMIMPIITTTMRTGVMAITMATLTATGIRTPMPIPMAATATITTMGSAPPIMIIITTIPMITIIMTTMITTTPMTPRAKRSITVAALPACMSPA